MRYYFDENWNVIRRYGDSRKGQIFDLDAPLAGWVDTIYEEAELDGEHHDELITAEQAEEMIAEAKEKANGI